MTPVETFHFRGMAKIVRAISLILAACVLQREARDKPGHDKPMVAITDFTRDELEGGRAS